MKSILAVLLVCTGLIGCGGGGGGGNSSTSGGNPTEAERAQAFLDEAIRLAILDAVVTCDLVVCSIADGSGGNVRPDGSVGHGCNWNCLESMIDDSGETRNYFIAIRWQRLPEGCFGEAEVVIATLNPDLCVPNQERF